MILLQLNSLDKQTAIFQIVVILITAAFLGYILAQLVMRPRLRFLQGEIAQRQLDIRECRSQAVRGPVPAGSPVISKPVKPVYIPSEPVTPGSDDLKVIEGVGPKIEELLNKHGIFSFATLADTSPVRISAILKSAGPRFQIQDPSMWPQQAALAKQGKWNELKEIQNRLISGR